MSLLLETTLGDITIDLDIDGSPSLCRNFIKLAKARYYTNTLFYNVQPGRICQAGDPKGDGTGGTSIYGLIDSILQQQSKSNNNNNNNKNKVTDETKSHKRFLKSDGRLLRKSELRRKGIVVATELGGVRDTIGSQFLITIDSGEGRALDDGLDGGGGGESLLWSTENENGNNDREAKQRLLSLGSVVEDENDVLGKINGMYLDKEGRPYADVRIIRAHILDDPYDDPPGMAEVLHARNVTLLNPKDLPENEDDICTRWLSSASPEYERPPEEAVEIRISAIETMEKEDEEAEKKRQEELNKKEDKSRAVMLEMLGDLPSADLKPPENVLFVCKLNSLTDDEDLQLIFSRFDPNAKADIIRDNVTGDSLQYAFVEFTTKEQCSEAYFKMNNALIDDRRIKVDFSQSVAKVWKKYAQQRHRKHTSGNHNNNNNNNHRRNNASNDNHSARGGAAHRDGYRRDGSSYGRRNDSSNNYYSDNRKDHGVRHAATGDDRRRNEDASRTYDNRKNSSHRNHDDGQYKIDRKPRSHRDEDSIDGSSRGSVSVSSRESSSSSEARDRRRRDRRKHHRKKRHHKDDRRRRHRDESRDRKRHRSSRSERRHKKSHKHRTRHRSRSNSP